MTHLVLPTWQHPIHNEDGKRFLHPGYGWERCQVCGHKYPLGNGFVTAEQKERCKLPECEKDHGDATP